MIWKSIFYKSDSDFYKTWILKGSVFFVWSVKHLLSESYNSKNVVSKDLYDENKLDDVLPDTIIAEWQNILENSNAMNSLKLGNI